MRNQLAIASLFLSFFLLFSCKDKTEQEIKTYSILRGCAIDEYSKPIQGVSIYTAPAMEGALTDSAGNFSLSALKIGDYSIIAYKKGYYAQKIDIKIESGLSPAPLTFVLIRNYDKDEIPPFLYSPSDSAILSDNSPTLRWTTAKIDNNSLSYSLTLSQYSDLKQALSFDVSASDYLYLYALKDNTPYFWQVSAFDAFGDTIRSDIRAYKTAGDLNSNMRANYKFDSSLKDGANRFLALGYGVKYGSDKFGNKNRALYFDGSDEYCTIADTSALFFKRDYAISFWVAPTSSSFLTDDVGADLINLTNIDKQNYIRIGFTKDRIGYFNICRNHTTFSFSPNYPISDNSWHKIAYIFEYGGANSLGYMKLYIDGNFVSSAQICPLDFLISGKIYIGSNSNRTSRYSGLLDNLLIYEKAINETEAKTITQK